MVLFKQPTADRAALADAERIHHCWNTALEAHDVAAASALYAEDATVEPVDLLPAADRAGDSARTPSDQ